MLAAGLISQIHAFISITLQADQVVSGLSLSFLATGISLVLGEGLEQSRNGHLASRRFTVPLLSQIPLIGPIFFTNQKLLVYLGYLLVPLAWYYINHTRPGLHLRAVGEYPAAADSLGMNVYGLRYLYVFVGGVLAGLAGATISLAISPGWFSELTTAGQGWIAIGLVIFAQWDPLRAAVGSYIFGALRRLVLDIQGPTMMFGINNPFYYNPYWGFFLEMLPYAFTIIVLVIGSREAIRKRLGAPTALGVPIYPRANEDCKFRGAAGRPPLIDLIGSSDRAHELLFVGYRCSLCGAEYAPTGADLYLPARWGQSGCDSRQRAHPQNVFAEGHSRTDGNLPVALFAAAAGECPGGQPYTAARSRMDASVPARAALRTAQPARVVDEG